MRFQNEGDEAGFPIALVREDLRGLAFGEPQEITRAELPCRGALFLSHNRKSVEQDYELRPGAAGERDGLMRRNADERHACLVSHNLRLLEVRYGRRHFLIGEAVEGLRGDYKRAEITRPLLEEKKLHGDIVIGRTALDCG